MQDNSSSPGTGGFGTLKGVYTPSLLTILGVIMYLRFGWVLGSVGLVQTLIIVTLSTAITFLTALSIAATATNMRVGGGGAYYMISRSLGVEPGAAIGVPLFFAQALVISFYIAGFAESLHQTFPGLPPTAISIVTLVALTLLAYLSADLALKTQFFILAVIAISLVVLFAGGPPQAPADGWGEVGQTSGFWTVFAVFFPAVTGIEAGIAMSGNLKNPSKSLPLGTLGAVLTGYAVYMAIPIFLLEIAPRAALLNDSMLMRRIADSGLFQGAGHAILLGVWGATLSSALSSLLGAPRTLQALARDRVVPRFLRFLAKGSGKGDEPRYATAVAFAIAFCGIVLGGSLDKIAPILSMFFLTSYGVLNLSAGLEAMIGSPSWRPTFRFPYALSLLGAFGCMATMFMINPGATFIAAFLCLGIFYVMQNRRLKARWGDMRYGLLTLLAQYAVYKLADSKPDRKSWRPNILALSGSPTSRWYLVELANAIVHGRGFLSVAAVVDESFSRADKLRQTRSAIREHLKKRGVSALVRIHIADDPMSGAQALVQAYGIGPLVPNTILLGETQKQANFLGFARLIRFASQRQRNLIVVREGQATPSFSKVRRIDVWWGGKRKNVGLMVALAYLLKTSPDWEDADLVLKTIVPSPEHKAGRLEQLKEFLAQGRIEAKLEVIVCGKDDSVFRTIRHSSSDAHLVFLGIRPPQDEESLEDYVRYYEDLLANTDGLPPTALVMAAEDIEFHRIFD